MLYMRKHQLAILTGFVASLCITFAQEPPPVRFKVEVNFVEVGAVVTDARAVSSARSARTTFRFSKMVGLRR